MTELQPQLEKFLENIKIPNLLWVWLKKETEIDELQIREW